MNRYVCIHCHFYQPPRENPWLEDVELQDSAYPYHDWNEKITDECYRQNATSRILDQDKKIIEIVNNYSKISFNFGPTLLSWLQRHAPDIYESIIEADKKSQGNFSGHGAAISQAYNHIIMPLANTRDKHTQVMWGIRDFEYRFGRKPEGMWLPETAVDLETLELLAEHEIKFTILAPYQAKRIRRIGSKQWRKIEDDRIDTTKPYTCQLASGRTINLFFYHRPVALDVVNGRLLKSGEAFAKDLTDILDKNPKKAQLAHIAADGETFGHHHRYADMALAYCLNYIESNNLANVTVYGEYVEKFGPTYEVEIRENTSWGCSHGVERWRGNCGCCYGRYPAGYQQWRTPLREAMDWLRDQLVELYENKMAEYVSDPWILRNEYIDIINDRSVENVENFLLRFTVGELSGDEKVTLLKLLEMQRNALLMYTSCGWFFDDISGIEAVQIMRYANRAIQLAKEINGSDFETGFKDIVEKAQVNAKKFANGKEVYQALVQPTNIDLNRVGAHFAITSLFEKYPAKIDIYCYSADTEVYDRVDAGIQKLATGRATLESRITMEKYPIDFAALHFGNQNLVGAVDIRMSDDTFFDTQEKLKNAFIKGDTAEVMRIMNVSFGKNCYTLWHLFKDEQRRILNELLEATLQEIEASFKNIYEHNYTIMQAIRGVNMPLPKALSTPAEFIINQQLCKVIQDDGADLDQVKKLVAQVRRLSLQLDKATLRFEAGRRINRLVNKLAELPENITLLETTEADIRILLATISGLDLHVAQNVFFTIVRKTYRDMNEKADSGDNTAKEWVELFEKLASWLNIKVQ
jgi:alpha-amylase/alpha-mannosidase (GH57 family)